MSYIIVVIGLDLSDRPVYMQFFFLLVLLVIVVMVTSEQRDVKVLYKPFLQAEERSYHLWERERERERARERERERENFRSLIKNLKELLEKETLEWSRRFAMTRLGLTIIQNRSFIPVPVIRGIGSSLKLSLVIGQVLINVHTLFIERSM